MTVQSLITATCIAGIVAGAIGWLLRRHKSASAWPCVIGFMVALPVMRHGWGEWSQLQTPSEALDWVPLGLVGLAVAEWLAGRNQARHSRLLLAIGAAWCILFAGRMMYGSIYLRPSDLQLVNVACIVGWGVAMACVWFPRVSKLGESQEHQQDDSSVIAGTQTPRFDALVQLILLGIVGANLAMSGSMTYGAATFVFAVSCVAGWLGSGVPSSLTAVGGITLLGLGPAFSETNWFVALLLFVSLLVSVVLAIRLSSRAKWLAGFVLTVSLLVATYNTINYLLASMEGNSMSPDVYEVYR